MVIRDAFHARVQVAVVAERRRAARAPSRRRARRRRRAARSRRPAGRRGARTASRTIRSTSEPTNGARSVLLITSRSARAMPGPPLRGMSSPAGDVDHEDLHVGERGREDRGQVVAAALDEDDVQRAGRGLELLDRLEVGGDVVADRRVRAAAGLDRGDPLGRQHAGGAQELGVLGRVDVVGDDAEPRPRPPARRTARRSGCSCRTRRGRRPRSAVRVQLAKRRSLCSRWMGAESSSATAAGAGSGRGRRRRPRAAASASCRRRARRASAP